MAVTGIETPGSWQAFGHMRRATSSGSRQPRTVSPLSLNQTKLTLRSGRQPTQPPVLLEQTGNRSVPPGRQGQLLVPSASPESHLRGDAPVMDAPPAVAGLQQATASPMGRIVSTGLGSPTAARASTPPPVATDSADLAPGSGLQAPPLLASNPVPQDASRQVTTDAVDTPRPPHGLPAGSAADAAAPSSLAGTADAANGNAASPEAAAAAAALPQHAHKRASPAAADDDCDNTASEQPPSAKRRRPLQAGSGSSNPGGQQPQQQQQQQQHPHLDRSHLRKQHETDDASADDEAAAAAANGGSSSGGTKEKQQQQQRKRGSAHKQQHQQPLLSFSDEGEEESTGLTAAGNADSATAAAAAAAATPAGGGSSTPSQQQQQQQHGGLGQATASRFRQEAKQAAAATAKLFTFRPSSHGCSSGGGSTAAAAAAAKGGSRLVDEDEAAGGLARGAGGGGGPAGLTQVHFGVAQARGARPYMEDRHCIITALNPASAAATAAALDAADDAAAAAAANGSSGLHPPPSAAAAHHQGHDGVGRCYAAIFDGHNGAGAADTAARKLHLLLASHPALRLFRGETGPPAVVRQEEAAVAAALKAAFRQVDDLVLAVARRDGTRDGATALVVLRLGAALYAAHAGDSRAVLCRDAAAYRLTEDHKPHLPQERNRIEAVGGRVDFQRCWRVVVEPRDGRPGSGLAVSRSLGDLDFKEPRRFVECEPDVSRLVLLPHRDTFVVLGSDGLWDVISDTDAVITAAAALKAYAAEHGGSTAHHQQQQQHVPGVAGVGSASSAAAAAHGGGGSSNGSGSGHAPHHHHPRAAGGSGAAAAAGLSAAELPAGLVYCDAAATAAAEALLRESLRRGTMDNVTVVVMLLQWS